MILEREKAADRAFLLTTTVAASHGDLNGTLWLVLKVPFAALVSLATGDFKKLVLWIKIISGSLRSEPLICHN